MWVVARGRRGPPICMLRVCVCLWAGKVDPRFLLRNKSHGLDLSSVLGMRGCPEGVAVRVCSALRRNPIHLFE